MSNMSRREVLKIGLALAASYSTGYPSLAHAQTSTRSRPIGKSGESLPVVGLGTYVAFDIGSRGAEWEQAREVLRLLVEHGGRVVDTSPMYGDAETAIGEMATELKFHDRLFLATKVWTSGREKGIRQMQDSMRKLKTDRVDLMQVHNLVDVQTHLATLREWKQAGRVRYVGVTHYHRGSYSALETLIGSEGLDFVQVNYSIAEREAEDRILPKAADTAAAVIINRPFAQGGLFGSVRGKPLPAWAADFDCTSWAQFFLKYILSHPAVTCVIPATRNPKHIVDNLGAGRGRLPDNATRKRMVDYLRNL